MVHSRLTLLLLAMLRVYIASMLIDTMSTAAHFPTLELHVQSC